MTRVASSRDRSLVGSNYQYPIGPHAGRNDAWLEGTTPPEVSALPDDGIEHAMKICPRIEGCGE